MAVCVCLKMCVWLSLSVCVSLCVCAFVCFGRIIRPCALLPESTLTTGLSRNESTLSRTLDCHWTHTHTLTLAHSQTLSHTQPACFVCYKLLKTNTHIITHILCKCLTEREGGVREAGWNENKGERASKREEYDWKNKQVLILLVIIHRGTHFLDKYLTTSVSFAYTKYC